MEMLDRKSPYLFLLIALLIFVVVLGFRVIYSTPIEFNGESILKWNMGRILLQTQDWGLLLSTHHELRWAVVIPNIILAVIIPTGYSAYYVTPIIFFSLFTVFCMLFLRQKKIAVYLCILLVCVISFDPMTHAMASQVNTGAYGLLYMVVGLIFLSKYVEKKTTIYIFLSGMFMFFSYASHITYIVFSAAPVLFLCVNKRDYKAAIIFITILGTLIIAESVTLSLISNGELSGGRIERLLDTKRAGSIKWKQTEYYEFHHFIDRWRMLPKYNLAIFITFIAGTASLMSSRVRGSIPGGIWLCFYSAAVYCIAVSFPIIGIKPMRLALDLHSRYLAPFFPLASVFLVWLISFFSSTFKKNIQSIAVCLVTISLMIIFFQGSVSYRCIEESGSNSLLNHPSTFEKLYCGLFRYSQEQNIYPAPDMFFLRADTYYSMFNSDYLEGRVSLFGGTRVDVFRQFVGIQHSVVVETIETPLGWYSVDGLDKEKCVIELSQVELPQDNYRDCAGLTVSRDLFD